MQFPSRAVLFLFLFLAPVTLPRAALPNTDAAPDTSLVGHAGGLPGYPRSAVLPHRHPDRAAQPRRRARHRDQPAGRRATCRKTAGGDPAVLNAIESRLRGYGLGKVSPECHSLCWNMLQPHDEGFPRIGISDSLPACVCSMPCWLHCEAVWTSFPTSVVD